MTLGETVLEKLTEWRPPSTGRQVLTVAHEASGWVAVFTVDRQDDLGCVLWDATLRRTAEPADDSTKALEAWAGRAASRVTGLLEALTVVEIDRPRGQALLRSNDPSRRKDDVHYYEVLLKGTREAVLRRYHGSHQGTRREQVPFTLTHEALAKVASDLTAER
jgi:hypothetical protein